MTQILRVRIARAIVVALLMATAASQVLPNVPWSASVAYAEDCGDSTCG